MATDSKILQWTYVHESLDRLRGFVIERKDKTTNSHFVRRGHVRHDVCEFVDGEIEAGHDYEWRVSAYFFDGTTIPVQLNETL